MIIELTNIIWPFQFYGHILIPVIIGLNPLDNRNRREVLDEDYWRRIAQNHGMFHAHGP